MQALIGQYVIYKFWMKLHIHNHYNGDSLGINAPHTHCTLAK